MISYKFLEEREVLEIRMRQIVSKTENSELVPHFGQDTKSSYVAQNSIGYTLLTNC